SWPGCDLPAVCHQSALRSCRSTQVRHRRLSARRGISYSRGDGIAKRRFETRRPSGMPMAARRSPALDRVDISILSALQRNGRSTIQGLAEGVGWRPRACLERVRRLEAAKIIIGYQAIIDIAHLTRPINIFAEIILDKQARQVGFERRLARIDNVVECWEVGG